MSYERATGESIVVRESPGSIEIFTTPQAVRPRTENDAYDERQLRNALVTIQLFARCAPAPASSERDWWSR